MGLATGLAAIRPVCGGGISGERELVELFRVAGSTGTGDGAQRLTLRQSEVLARLVTGESNSEIARQLVVSHNTVKTQISNLLSELQARDRSHTAVIGLGLGLINWPDAGEHRYVRCRPLRGSSQHGPAALAGSSRPSAADRQWSAAAAGSVGRQSAPGG